MHRSSILLLFAFFQAVAVASPMPSSVSSWEGEFVRQLDDTIVEVAGREPIRLCFYRLAGGSRGVVVGLADSRGDILIPPRAAQKGVQPVYRCCAVNVLEEGEAELVLIFDVQGNGGLILTEKYLLKLGSVRFSSRSLYGGRHDPKWRKGDGEPGATDNPGDAQ